MTYPTEAAIAALAANGHAPRRTYGPIRTLQWVGRFVWRSAGGWPDPCHPEEARDAVRCAMLDRLAEAGYGVSIIGGGQINCWRLPHPMSSVETYPDLLAAYTAVCHAATTGEVAVERERPHPECVRCGKTFHPDEALCHGCQRSVWENNEEKTLTELGITEESAKVPDGWERVKGGAMPTNEEQYEAMVARGHPCAVELVKWKDGDPYWACASYNDWRVMPEVVSACLLAGQLEAMTKEGWSYSFSVDAPPGRPRWHAERPRESHYAHSWFSLYCQCVRPLPAQPEPSAAEELVEAVRNNVADCILGGSPTAAMERIGEALGRYEARAAKGGA